MSEATEKQISFAISLGIEDPKSKSKETLKVLIDEALKNRDQGKEASSKAQKQLSDGQIGVTNGIKIHLILYFHFLIFGSLCLIMI